MQVPLLDLKSQYASIRAEVLGAVSAVLDSQLCCNGPAVRELESRIAAYCGCKAAVGVSSGTDALLVALMAMDIAPGDEVITSPYTFFATAGCVWRLGARPVFVDIEPDTFNIDPAKIEQAITPRTRAIIPVHLFGQMADMDPIMEIASRRGLKVLEDAAQAIGARYKDRPAGSIGSAGAMSFYPTKNLGAVGDGGMIVTQDADLARRMEFLRNHGQHQAYHHKWVGGNFRLDSIQAAALIVKLKHLDAWTAKRRANAARYDALFKGCEKVVTPKIRDCNFSIYNQYVIRAPRRDELQAYLRQEGIGTAVYYPISLHQQECFGSLGYRKGDFPNSEKAAEESLALPIFPELSDEQIEFTAERVMKFYSRG